MKKWRLFLSASFVAMFLSCSEDNNVSNEVDNGHENAELINKKDQVDGVTYSMDNLSINPQLVALQSEMFSLKSSENEIENGVFRLEIKEDAVLGNLVVDNILYLQSVDKTYLRKIITVRLLDANTVELATDDAYIGDLFNGGTLEINVDVEKSEQMMNAKNGMARSSYQNGFSFDILNYIRDYESDGLNMNLDSSIKAFVNVKMGFGRFSKKIPNEVEVTFEIKTDMNPWVSVVAPMNKTIQFDLIDNVPTQFLDLLKTIEVEVDLPLGDVGTLPTKISIAEINLPVEVKANTTEAIDIQFDANGIFKVGYAYFSPTTGKKSHVIYENTMVSGGVLEDKAFGEISTDMAIVIVPKITLVNMDLFKVNSKVRLGMETNTKSVIKATAAKAEFSSKGVFYASGTVAVTTLGFPIFSTDILQLEKELWNIGEKDNAVVYSNMQLTKPSKVICAAASYNYAISLDYKYAEAGKRIAGDLVMTYDVYDDSRAVLRTGESATFTPANLTATSFTFNLCIPFKVDAWGFFNGFTKPVSYLKNIVITDGEGNESIGIVNPADGKVYAEYAVGTPYNTNFWK